MDNKIEHFFVLKPDGKIYWIEKMPEYPKSVYRGEQSNKFKEYEQALQSAIDNAVEVSNQEEVRNTLLNIHEPETLVVPGKIYTMRCEVNKTVKWKHGLSYMPYEVPVALVTFSQPERDPDKFKKMFEESSLFKSKKPEREETQEERYNGFRVTIDDGFVVYEYKFPGGDHLSIHQVAEAISDQTGLEIESSIQVNPYVTHWKPLDPNP